MVQGLTSPAAFLAVQVRLFDDKPIILGIWTLGALGMFRRSGSAVCRAHGTVPRIFLGCKSLAELQS